MQSACFQCPNPNLVPADSTTPLNGLVVYQKQFNQNYPFAFGPRLGGAYQINPKTVFRAGAGISYANSGFNAGLSNTDMDFYAIAAPAGNRPDHLVEHPGNPTGGRARSISGMEIRLLPGNIYGNGPITAPLSGPGFPTQTSASGCGGSSCLRDPCKTDRFAVHYDRVGHGKAAAHFPMEHRAAA